MGVEWHNGREQSSELMREAGVVCLLPEALLQLLLFDAVVGKS